MTKKIDIVEQITNDKATRQELTYSSFFWFIHIFLSRHIEYDLAPFQEEMITLAEDERLKLMVIMAFRGSGKSTILNLSYALWAILGKQQKKFIVILSNTQAQARNHFANIKQELESNELLAHDLGPFRVDEGSWNSYSLELEHFGAKIISVSREQSIRGMRYREHRPDLIICDDVEDTNYETNVERKNLFAWFMSELVPTGSQDTRYVVLGNLTQEESLLMELRKDIREQKSKDGIFRAYPIADQKGRLLWPKKFSTKKIEQLLERLPKNVRNREYYLKIIPEFIIRMDCDEPPFGYTEDPDLPPRQIPIIRKMQKYDIRCPYISKRAIIY